MAFVTKTWKDRLVEYAGRRKIKNVATGEETLVDVSRSEGTVSQAGDAFSAANMNNLEQRIKNEFDTVNSSLAANGNQLCMDYHDGKYGVNTDPQRGADTFIPFHSGNFEISFTNTYVLPNTFPWSFNVEGVDTIELSFIDQNVVVANTTLDVVPMDYLYEKGMTSPNVNNKIASVSLKNKVQVDVSKYKYISIRYTASGATYIYYTIKSINSVS